MNRYKSITTTAHSISASLCLALLLAFAANPLDLVQPEPQPPSAPPALSGTKTIPGDYATLTGAIADIQTQGVDGPLVLELQAGYTSGSETFPLTFTNLTGASAVNTITVRPATGATGLVISSADTTAATVDLNGAQFVTIDGRPGGVGSHAGSGGGAASQLTIENTSTGGVAVRFINEASGNTIRYTTLPGGNRVFGSGTVVFGTTTTQQTFMLTVQPPPAVTYTFNCGSGSSTWTNTARWTPSYPGTTINAGDTAILNCTGNNSVPIIINGNLQLNFVGYVPGWTQGAPFTFNSGSTFTNNALWLSNGSTYTAHAGSIITNNERLDIAGFTQESGATLNNNTPASTLLFGNGGTMTGNLTNGAGVVDIGTQSDNLTGNFNAGTTGTFRVQYMADFGPVYVGKLSVSGTATLGGTFDFTTNMPFGTPSVGQQYVVLEAAQGRSGTFTNSYVDFAPGLRATISYNATQAIITIGEQPPQTFVVTKTADTDDGVCDADCSLREAITAANDTPAADTINFNVPTNDAGCNGGAGPCTILLGATPAPQGIGIGQLQLAQSVTINGPVPPALPVTVDGQNANRVFIVSNGTSFVNNLTVAHAGTTGQFASGGGLFVNGAATATLTGMTFRDNTVSGAKGGGAGVNLGGTLNIYNSTFSNNTAVTGGALFNESNGTLRLVNVTVVGNTATGGGAGGLDTQNQTTSIRNSIIAGNTATNLSGTFTDLGNNLTSGDPMVGPLANNGGPTFTRALLNGSPAIDAGSDCVFNNTCSPAVGVSLTTDQRGAGFSRKQDGNSNGTAVVDIGAYEAPFGTTPFNRPPYIEARGDLSLSQGAPALNTSIGYVYDEDGDSITVTLTSANPSNGVTLSNLAVDSGGEITASISVACGATSASFTLQADDSKTTATTTLEIEVTANTAPTLGYEPRAFVNKTVLEGLSGDKVNAVVVAGNTIYVGTGSIDNNGGLSISTDGGASFVNRTTANGLGANTVNDISVNGSTVAVSHRHTSVFGYSISTDGGATFTYIEGGSFFYSIVESGGTIYGGSNGVGIKITSDGGNTFTTRTTADGLGSGVVRDLFVTGNTVYAATSGGLSISTDGGTTFVNRTTADGLGNNFVEGVFVVGNTVYAATFGGLSTSINGGATFTNKTTADGLGDNWVHKVFASGSTVYAATNGGLSISTDGGATFVNKTTADGLGSNFVNAVSALGGVIFAGTDGGLSFGTGIQPGNPTVVLGGSTTISPSSGPGDNGTIASFAVHDPGTFTGTISVNNTTGVVSISNAQPVGTHTITIRSIDNCGGISGTTDATISLAVTPPPNSPPTITAGGPYTISEGSPLTFTATANDPDGDTLTYTWDVNGDGTFGDATGASPTLTWSQLQTLGITDGPATVNNLKVRADDGHGHVVTSASASLTVNNTPPTLTLSGNPSVNLGATYTLSLTETDPGADTVSGWTINWGDGNVQNVAGNPSSVTHVYSAAGSRTISATATDEDGTHIAGNTVSVMVNKANTAVAISSSANPSVFGQPVTFTAAVTAMSPGAGTPTGTVTFFDGATPLGTVAVNGSGVATLMTSTLSVATHPITATYNGDTNFDPSTSMLVDQVVNKANTSTMVVSSQNPSTFGQPVTFTATVTAMSPGAGTRTGTVNFFDGATNIGSGTIDAAGMTSITTSTLAGGTHDITAMYVGDGNFNPSTSAVLQQVVNKASTTTTLSSSSNSSVFGQQVTFTATVSSPAAWVVVPTGTVTFFNGATAICTAVPLATTVGGQQATCQTSTLAVGSHPITATYNGDTNFSGSPGTLVPNQVVNKGDTTTTMVSSSANPSAFGQPVTFTAQVTVNPMAAGVPTGIVVFFEGQTSLGFGAVNAAGVATASISTLSAGSHVIQAVYQGDGNFNGSISANSITQVVTATISGRVLQSNAPFADTPLANVTMTLSGGANQTTTTDANGDYSFPGLTGGLTYTVTPAGVFEPISRTFNNVMTNTTNANFLALPAGRVLKLENVYTDSGSPVSIPLSANTSGAERHFAASVEYDPLLLTFTGADCGTDLPNCAFTMDPASTPGHLGFTVNDSSSRSLELLPGIRQVVRLNFNTAATTESNTAIVFTDTPTQRVTSDANGNPLITNYQNGFMVFSQGVECDLATRPKGDGLIRGNDIDIARQLMTGGTVNIAFNEYQRLDCANGGNGMVTAADLQEIRNIILGIKAPSAAGGPFEGAFARAFLNDAEQADGRSMKVIGTTVSPGEKATIEIELDGTGDETAALFTLAFDSSRLANPVVKLGHDIPSGTGLMVGMRDPNHLTILVDSSTAFGKRAARIVTINFDVAETAVGELPLHFTTGSLTNPQAQDINATYKPGAVFVKHRSQVP